MTSKIKGGKSTQILSKDDYTKKTTNRSTNMVSYKATGNSKVIEKITKAVSWPKVAYVNTR